MMKNSGVLETDKCKDLEEVDNFFREKFNKELLLFSNIDYLEYGFRQTLRANRKLGVIANKIRNATNDGKELSPFEKFMLAYEFVTDFVYNEGGDTAHLQTSHWVPVLDGDKIICGGYASLLEELCRRIFPEKEVIVMPQFLKVFDTKGNYSNGHANNLVLIKDEKYNIDGLFYCDACWDSKVNGKKHYVNCCIPLQDILYMSACELEFKGNVTDLYLKQFQEYRGNKETLEKDIESYLKDWDFEKERKILIGDDLELEEYDSPFSSIYKTNELYDYENQASDYYDERFAKLIKKYRNLNILKMSEQILEQPEIKEIIDKLNNYDFNDEEFERMYEELGAAIYSELIRLDANNMDSVVPVSESFTEYIKYFYVTAKTNGLKESLVQKKEAEIESFRKENARSFLHYINRMSNSIVPIEAFINHFTYIGKSMGLEGDKLRAFVKRKIADNVKYCAKFFESGKCKGCFATASAKKEIATKNR